MDDLDQAIIRELTQDARKPFSAIAKKLDTSTQTVMRRYNELKANGTIVLSAIRVSLEKLGYTGTAHLRIDTSPDTSSAEIVEQLGKTSSVFIATRTIVNYEVYAVLAFREMKDLYEKIVKIKDLPNVTSVQVSLAIPGIRHFPPKTSQFNIP
jgi:Lrp/AsnC family transcriptional regulator, regulator for asnA, asnC and gidA